MMALRTLLVVEAGDPAASAAAWNAGADAVVLDLASEPRHAADRVAAATAFRGPRRDGSPRLVLRLPPPGTPPSALDLAALLAFAPDAVLQPVAHGARDVQHLACRLAVAEAEAGRPDGGTAILAEAASTAAAVLALPSIPGSSRRLGGLVWHPDALAADLGMAAEHDPTLAQARATLLLSSRAAGVPAWAWLRAGTAAASRRQGFAGALTADPARVAALAADWTNDVLSTDAHHPGDPP